MTHPVKDPITFEAAFQDRWEWWISGSQRRNAIGARQIADAAAQYVPQPGGLGSGAAYLQHSYFGVPFGALSERQACGIPDRD
jgi:hypothetical protein